LNTAFKLTKLHGVNYRNYFFGYVATTNMSNKGKMNFPDAQ